jgi:histidinol dehydrogenase
MLWLEHTQSDFDAAFARLLVAKRDLADDVEQQVRAIVDDVRRNGDRALFSLTARFDHFALTGETLRVGEKEIGAAVRTVSSEALGALRFAAQRIEAFHERQRPRDDVYADASGVTLGVRWTAIDAVGLYVPGGLAAYPSSVLMNAIPARIAGVKRIVAVTPAPGGTLNPLVLAACDLAGVREIYRVGGAQAVAALAFGTASIEPVDKIVGPGNAYVAAAKRQLFGTVGIESIAGPSEVLIIADAHNDPAWIACDLLAQAEHDEAAQSILITDDAAFAKAVAAAVEGELRTLPREKIARASWDRHGAIVIVAKLDDAVRLADRLAPEHVQIATSDPKHLAGAVKHAGAIFLGAYTPEAIGDYVGGPNHVLPTERSARFSSGLGVLDFMKRTTLLGCTQQSLGELGPQAATLADAEGLGAHARSIRIRLSK